MRAYDLVISWPKESSLNMWLELFSPGLPNFLNRFPRYVQVDIVSHSGESNHRRWFSWCESRMRLLIRGVEVPNMIFCHPITNCYHRKMSDDDNDSNVQNMEPARPDNLRVQTDSYSSIVTKNIASVADLPLEKYCSTFFIGLTFCNGLKSADISSTIQVSILFSTFCFHFEIFSCRILCIG